MSEILFKNLAIENFLSIGEGAITLDSRGLLLIQGVNSDDPSANSNGAGKSSVVDSLCWALYGTTARGKSGDGVINRFEGKNCRVEVTFTLNEKTYTVTRHRKHSKGKNRLLFTCDGDDLTLGTDKLTQDSIEKTIGCNLEVFTASIYAGQNNMPNLPAMTDKELKLLVEKAAGIELLDAAYDIARDRSRAAASARDVSENTQRHASSAIATQTSQLDLYHSNVDQWKRDQDRQIAEYTESLKDQAIRARTLKSEVDGIDEADINTRIAELEAKLIEVNKPLPEIVAPTPPDCEVQPHVPEELRNARFVSTVSDGKLNDHKKNIAAWIAEVRGLDATVGSPCSECGKPYHKEDLETRRGILTQKLREEKELLQKEQENGKQIAAQIDRLNDKHLQHCADVNERNAALQSDYKAAQEAHQNALRERREAIASSDSAKLMDALKRAQSELQTLTNKRHALTSQIDTLRRDKQRLESLKVAENPHLKSVAIAEKQLESLKEEAIAAQNALQIAEQRVADIAAVVDLFSPKGMRGEVLDSVTPFLNTRTAQYLGVLSDGSITAEWKTVGETGKGELREKFHIAVQNTHGSEDFDGLSGGEQRKVRISTAMALQDLVASRADRPIKLFIADEADDALDVAGLERLMSVLDDKARHVGTVLIISHNDLADWVSNQITVMKSGGKSHIVEL